MIILIEAMLLIGSFAAPYDDIQMNDFDTFLTTVSDVRKDKKEWTTYNSDEPNTKHLIVLAFSILCFVIWFIIICYKKSWQAPPLESGLKWESLQEKKSGFRKLEI